MRKRGRKLSTAARRRRGEDSVCAKHEAWVQKYVLGDVAPKDINWFDSPSPSEQVSADLVLPSITDPLIIVEESNTDDDMTEDAPPEDATPMLSTSGSAMETSEDPVVIPPLPQVSYPDFMEEKVRADRERAAQAAVDLEEMVRKKAAADAASSKVRRTLDTFVRKRPFRKPTKGTSLS